MRLHTPRIAPLGDADWTGPLREALAKFAGRGEVLNIFRTLAQAPEALEAFSVWGGYVMGRRNSLPKREREIVILRTGYLCRSGYEFTQHSEIALACGLTLAEIDGLAQDIPGPAWSGAERALIAACDDLHRGQFITTPVWQALAAHFTQRQCMDVVFTAAQYTQVSMILNSFGVQLDAGQTLHLALAAYEAAAGGQAAPAG